MNVSPILLEVYKNRFASIAGEMGETLMRTGYSPNIKERRDFSCAVFDAAGNMVALNDPFQGGAHLPDITIVAPVFAPGRTEPAFLVANRAHHADVGGVSRG